MTTDSRPAEIEETDWAATPAGVRRLVLVQQATVAAVRADLAAVQAENAALQARVERLEARLNQSSRTSSKPPSSDPPSVPPRSSRRPSDRLRGGQPGHPGHAREVLPTEQVDRVVRLVPPACQRCGTALPADLPAVAPGGRRQIWELVPRLVEVTEYQRAPIACPCCALVQTAPWPDELPPGAFGPGVVALTALLQRYRLSDRETADFWQAVAGLPISLGSIPALCDQVSAALAPVDAAIHQHIQQQPVVHVDETGWREETRRGWLWTATTAVATCFRIQRRRNRAAFTAVLEPDFGGLLVSDRYSVYRRVPAHRRQICWAHLRRDLKGCLERTPAGRAWAAAVLDQVEAIFAAWRWYRADQIDRIHLQVLTAPHRHAIQALLQGPPLDDPPAEALRRELLKYWDALWTFLQVEGVEPTNNAAERALRPAVLWRKGCFGTQSATGSRFVERLLSVVATCRQQGRDVLTVLRDAVIAAWAHAPAPALFSTG
ncbi:MAG: IS66 family transposase [Aquabacterium sp.]